MDEHPTLSLCDMVGIMQIRQNRAIFCKKMKYGISPPQTTEPKSVGVRESVCGEPDHDIEGSDQVHSHWLVLHMKQLLT